MSKSKARGTRFESDVVGYLREHGFPYAERRAQSGNRDRGDITGIPGWCMELKATNRIDLGEFMAEAEIEARNANCEDFALIVKRRMKSVGESYAVVPLRLLVELMAYDGRPAEVAS